MASATHIIFMGGVIILVIKATISFVAYYIGITCHAYRSFTEVYGGVTTVNTVLHSAPQVTWLLSFYKKQHNRG